MSKVRAVVLDEQKSVEMGYEKEQLESIVSDVENQEVFVNADAISLTKVVGVVSDAYYSRGEGLIAECTIVDDDVMSLIEKGHVTLAPSLVVDDFTDYYIKSVNKLFTTADPEYMVGEVEVLEHA